MRHKRGIAHSPRQRNRDLEEGKTARLGRVPLGSGIWLGLHHPGSEKPSEWSRRVGCQDKESQAAKGLT